MKTRSGILVGCLIFVLMSISGCRYVCWVMDIAPQNMLDEDCYCCSLKYIRSLHIYDQFYTVAHFDALWLSDEIRTDYAQLYADKRQLCPERYEAFLRRQLEENRHYISFYLLTVIPGDQGRALLSEKTASWSVALDIDGVVYQPAEIKVVELPPEYRVMFGKLWTRFKIPYLIKFDAIDVDGAPLITGNTREIILLFSTICRNGECMRWQINAQGAVIDDCQQPNKLAYDL